MTLFSHHTVQKQSHAKTHTHTHLWGESIADRGHVIGGPRRGHEAVGVAGEAVAIGREAVGGAGVGG